jgi:hypothetical protein
MGNFIGTPRQNGAVFLMCVLSDRIMLLLCQSLWHKNIFFRKQGRPPSFQLIKNRIHQPKTANRLKRDRAILARSTDENAWSTPPGFAAPAPCPPPMNGANL